MNWQYIAGFFDGEGSIVHNGKGYRITIAQTNKKVLINIKNFTHIGYVITVTKRKKHWKDCWVYYIAKQNELNKFLINIAPYVIVKKTLTKQTLKKLKPILINQKIKKERREYLNKKAKNLRKQGLSYRAIGKKLGVDFGYIRRVILK